MWYFNDFFCSGQKTREIIVIDVLVCISFHDFFLAWTFLNFLAPLLLHVIISVTKFCSSSHFLLQFVAHPNVQQLLASIWYEGLPGFRQMNMILQFLEVCRIGLLFPLFSLAYIICPWASFSQKLRKPFIKFICTSASYFTFLCK